MRWAFGILLISCTSPEPERVASGTAELTAPRWNEVAIDNAARALLRDASRIAADRAPVPVLVPRSLASKATVMSEDHWAAVHIGHDGLTISVHATDQAFAHPEVEPMQSPRTLRGAPVWITENEQIWSAAWTEHGVAYSLELECARPSEPRCADETLLLQLANELVAVSRKS